MNYSYEYPRPAVTTDAILILNENQKQFILLIQRGNQPFKDSWALPGGFVEMEEELDVACARELNEETGITGVQLKQFATFGSPDRDPRGRTISIVFWAVVNTRIEPKSGDDAKNAKWFLFDELPPLAFDHREIIQHFIDSRLFPIR